MARGHEVRIASETREFERGIRDGVIDPLEDGVKAFGKLDDAARYATRAGERGIDRLEDGLRDARRETERLERAHKDVERTGERSFRKVGNIGTEVSGELTQNLGETLSSFRGDLEDLPQIAQDTLGGLAGSGALGGIAGLAATAAGAAGLGLITASIQAQVEEAEKLKERLSEAYREAIDAGRDYIDEAQVFAELQSLMFDTDRAGEYSRILEDQKKLGIDLEVLAGANIGRQEDLTAVQDRINVLKERGSEIDRGADSILGDIDTSLLGIENRWGTVQDATTEQKNRVEELEAAQSRMEQNARNESAQTRDQLTRRYEEMKRRYEQPITGRVVMEVDDTAVRQYRPPTRYGDVRYSPSGRPME